MITKVKKSISLSKSMLKELTLFNKGENISQFIETALTYYINELKKHERRRRDMEIINANAKRFNREAEENLKYQAVI